MKKKKTKQKNNCVRARDKVLEEPCNSQLLCSETENNKKIKNKIQIGFLICLSKTNHEVKT